MSSPYLQSVSNISTAQSAATPADTYTRSDGSIAALPAEGGSDYASRTRAFINRETYNDYLTRFQPFEESLIDDVQGDELLNERLSAIRSDSQESTLAARKGSLQRLQRFGVQQDDRQKQASLTSESVNQGASQAALENATRRHIQDRNTAIVSGGPTRQAITTG